MLTRTGPAGPRTLGLSLFGLSVFGFCAGSIRQGSGGCMHGRWQNRPCAPVDKAVRRKTSRCPGQAHASGREGAAPWVLRASSSRWPPAGQASRGTSQHRARMLYRSDVTVAQLLCSSMLHPRRPSCSTADPAGGTAGARALTMPQDRTRPKTQMLRFQALTFALGAFLGLAGPFLKSSLNL
jgi:hypothetical protein